MARENRSKWMKILAGIALGLLITASIVSTVLIPFLYTPSALVKTWYGLSAIASLVVEFFVLAAYAYKSKTSNNTNYVVLPNAPPLPDIPDKNDDKHRRRSADVTNDLDSKETKSSESSSTSSMSSSSYSSIASSVSNAINTSSTSSSTSTPANFPLSFTTSMTTTASLSSTSSDAIVISSEPKEKEKKVLVPEPEPQPRDPETIIAELLDVKDSSNSDALWQELLRGDDDEIGNYMIQQSPYRGASILWLAFYNKKWEVALELLKRAPENSVDPNVYHGFKWQTSMFILMLATNNEFWAKDSVLLAPLYQIYNQLIEKSSQRIDLNRVGGGKLGFSSCCSLGVAFYLDGNDTEQRFEKLLNHSKPIDLNAPVPGNVNDSKEKKIVITTVSNVFLEKCLVDPSKKEGLKLLLKKAKSGIDFDAKRFALDNRKESSYAFRPFFYRLFSVGEAGKNAYAVIQLLVREQRYPLVFSSNWIKTKPLVMLQLLSLAMKAEDHFTFLKLMDAGMYPPIKTIEDWLGRPPGDGKEVGHEIYEAGMPSGDTDLAELRKDARLIQKLYQDLRQEMTCMGWIIFISARENLQIPISVGLRLSLRLIFYPYLHVEEDYFPKLLPIMQKFVLQGLEQFRNDSIFKMATVAVHYYRINYEKVSEAPLPQWRQLRADFCLALNRSVSDYLLQYPKFRLEFYERIKECAKSGKDLYPRKIEDLVQQTKISLGMVIVPESKSKAEAPIIVQKPNTCPLEYESYFRTS